MSETELAVKMEGFDHEIGSLKHRVTDLEKQQAVLQELAISVNRMAVSMENMTAEQKQQGERLAKLEREPAETGRQVKMAIITALIGAVVGAAVTAIFTIL